MQVHQLPLLLPTPLHPAAMRSRLQPISSPPAVATHRRPTAATHHPPTVAMRSRPAATSSLLRSQAPISSRNQAMGSRLWVATSRRQLKDHLPRNKHSTERNDVLRQPSEPDMYSCFWKLLDLDMTLLAHAHTSR